MSTNLGQNDKEFRVTFGRWLASRRVLQGYSQGELAEKLGVSPSVASRWEQDKRVPRLDPLLTWEYIKLLGVTIEEYAERFRDGA